MTSVICHLSTVRIVRDLTKKIRGRGIILPRQEPSEMTILAPRQKLIF